VSGWQPIETAPRDGEDVLLYIPEMLGWPESWAIVTGQWDEPRWSSNALGGFNMGNPTHWAPLPSPPEQL
jgi:hypothetical protein